MNPMQRSLFVAISSHGYGHIAQVGPVLARLAQVMPDLSIVIQCGAKRAQLESMLLFPFQLIEHADDIGMLMHNALDIDVEGSHRAYLDFHRDLPARIQAARERIQSVKPDLVLSDVPYVVNVAARQLGIPVINLSSLEWADIYPSYCGHMPGASQVIEQMVDAYNQAECFLAPEPSMPMPSIEKVIPIGPIARIGINRGDEIRKTLQLDPAVKLVLFSHGGVGFRLDPRYWTRKEGIHVLMEKRHCPTCPGVTAIETLPYSYIDLMCSSDAFIIKPGYGSFAESACNGIPVIYTRRPDWPEEPSLVQWINEKANCLELSREHLEKGQFLDSLHALWSQARKPKVEPTGIAQAVDILAQYF